MKAMLSLHSHFMMKREREKDHYDFQSWFSKFHLPLEECRVGRGNGSALGRTERERKEFLFFYWFCCEKRRLIEMKVFLLGTVFALNLKIN